MVPGVTSFLLVIRKQGSSEKGGCFRFGPGAPFNFAKLLVQRGISLKPLMAGVLLFPLPLRFMFIQRNGEHRP